MVPDNNISGLEDESIGTIVITGKVNQCLTPKKEGNTSALMSDVSSDSMPFISANAFHNSPKYDFAEISLRKSQEIDLLEIDLPESVMSRPSTDIVPVISSKMELTWTDKAV
jgi:hypothetical protein